MKKQSLLIVGLGLLLTSLVPSSTRKNDDLIFSCEENLANGVTLRKAQSASSVEVGKTYVQVGENDEHKMMRFATPVSGDFTSLTYYVFVDGYSDTYINKNVDVVYKGIATGDSVSYFDGTNVVNEQTELTNDWYWACFTIEFTSYKFYASNISAYVKATSSTSEITSEAKENVTLTNELTSSNVLKQLDSKTFGMWELEDSNLYLLTVSNDSLVVDVKTSLTSEPLETYTLNYVDVDGHYYVFADNKENQLEIKYSSQYDNQLDVNGIINKKKFSFSTFNKYVPITSLSLTASKSELIYGTDKSFTISPVTNKGATAKEFTWTCDNEQFEIDEKASTLRVNIPDELYEIEYYDEDSVEVTFTATSIEGVEASITIKIRKQILTSSIKLTETSSEVEVGATYQINASVNEDADNKTLNYKSNNTKIATVDKNGLIKGIAAGQTTITISADDNGAVSKTFTIVVKASTAVVPNSIVGNWTGEDSIFGNEVNITIDKNGNLSLVCDDADLDEKYVVDLEKSKGNSWIFVKEDNAEFFLEVYIKTATTISITIDYYNESDNHFDENWSISLDNTDMERA